MQGNQVGPVCPKCHSCSVKAYLFQHEFYWKCPSCKKEVKKASETEYPDFSDIDLDFGTPAPALKPFQMPSAWGLYGPAGISTPVKAITSFCPAWLQPRDHLWDPFTGKCLSCSLYCTHPRRSLLDTTVYTSKAVPSNPNVPVEVCDTCGKVHP